MPRFVVPILRPGAAAFAKRVEFAVDGEMSVRVFGDAQIVAA